MRCIRKLDRSNEILVRIIAYIKHSNFHAFEAVSRYCDPQHQVDETYSYSDISSSLNQTCENPGVKTHFSFPI